MLASAPTPSDIPSVISVDALSDRATALGFSLTEQAASGLAAYLGLLMKWNKVMNLVGTSSWTDTLDSLVVDSFHLAAFLRDAALPDNPVSWDLGAGAGLPGIPLRLVWRDGSYTMVEAREKRALFMRTVLSSLDLGHTSVFQGRAEAFFRRSGQADLIISRAFMPWRDMLAFIENALAPKGRVVFLTLSPVPEDLPGDWHLAGQKAYVAAGKERYFWCLCREAA